MKFPSHPFVAKRAWGVFAVVICLLFLFPAANAQQQGSIFGTVTDPSGAVVPGAAVTLLDTQTGHVQNASSNSAGTYVIPSVNPGHYKLTISAQGFKAFVSQGIVMQVDENRQVSAQLILGSVSQDVIVQAGQAHVDTRSAALTQVVDTRRVEDLPLNGRNPLDLQTLVAGAGGTTENGGQQQNAYVSMNGERFNSNNYTLDGVDNEDPFFNSPSIVPNPDALSQFSIETANYSAREGRGSGAQVNAVIKSGTNHFHGTLFEYIRNQVLDAKPYFSDKLAPYRRNQFGGTLGGPVLHNKLFFFFGYQGTRTSASPNVSTMFVPSAEERTGDFSELLTVDACNQKVVEVKDPATGKQAPGNKLPAGSLNQASLGFLAAFVPSANGSCNSYTYTPPTTESDDQYISRIDSNLGSKDTLSGHLIYASANSVSNPTSNRNLPGFLSKIQYTNWHVAVSETHVFSPRLLNLATFGFDDINRVQLPIIPKQVTWGDLGAGIVRADPDSKVAIGYDTEIASYFNAQTPWPLNQLRKEYQAADFLSWTLGNHSLSMGGDLRWQNTLESQDFHNDAQVTFNPSFTGNSLADFITGHPNTIAQQSFSIGNPRNLSPDLYFQDDWRATRKLTLNLGIRWAPFVPYNDALHHMSQFRAGQQSTIFPKAPVGSVFPGDAGVGPATFSAHWADFAPRLGFALDVFGNGKTALRGGFGIYYGNVRMQAYNGDTANQPFSVTIVVNKPSGGLDHPYADLGGSPFPFTPPTASESANHTFSLPASITDLAPDFRNEESYQWNVNVQQQLPWQMVSTIAYVGNEAAHLFLAAELNPGLFSLNGGRPYAPLYSSINRQFSGGHSGYNSLQLTLNRRFSHGFTVLANYTWSKELDNGSFLNAVADPLSIPANRGLGDLDIRNNFVASGIWQLPSPRGAARPKAALLGGWELNWIWSMQSGQPFTVTSGVDNSKSHVNRDWADVDGGGITYPHESRPQQVQHYFNTEAYTVNVPGTFGDSGRNSLIGPGQDLVTFGVVKSLFTREKFKVLLRAEGFNVFNHPTLGNPNANISSPQVGKITSAGDPRVGQFALRVQF